MHSMNSVKTPMPAHVPKENKKRCMRWGVYKMQLKPKQLHENQGTNYLVNAGVSIRWSWDKQGKRAKKTKKPHGSTPPNDATVSPTVQHLDASKRKCSGQTTLNVATAWADYWIRQQ
jgi:hypothetical protein